MITTPSRRRLHYCSPTPVNYTVSVAITSRYPGYIAVRLHAHVSFGLAPTDSVTTPRERQHGGTYAYNLRDAAATGMITERIFC